MPVLNGQQTVIQIKKIKPEIPIIMTDSFPDRDAEAAQEAGAICCLNKPFDLDELRQKIEQLLHAKEIKSS
jgi:two-component system response regulator (stage 0 sporulation protein F)